MSKSARWSMDNPHPLSQTTTELVWEGKYDEYGNRRTVDVAGLSMPLQRIETVDEPAARAVAQGELFDSHGAHADEFRNMLVWGDNKLVLSSVLRDYKGNVDLIYIDPPFDVGADFTMNVPIGDSARDAVDKDQSIMEMVAYRDMWGRGTDSYLHMLYERLVIARDLVSESGAVVVHVGDKVTAAVRHVMNDVFGEANYRNTIIIPRGIKNVQSQFDRVRSLSVGHDTLLLYTKSEKTRIAKLSLPGTKEQKGKWDTFWRGTDRPTMRYEIFGIQPSTGQWRWGKERAYRAQHAYEQFCALDIETDLDEYWTSRVESGEKLDMLRLGANNTVQYYVPPRDYKLASTLWTAVRTRGAITTYATEKHEELLEVVVDWLSDEGGLVLDFFCGSGTTGAVAEKLGRRWIMCDLGRFAVHTSRKRLIEVQRELHSDGKPYRAFDVHNLGRYERQWWQKEHLHGVEEGHRRVVMEFYRAEPLFSPTRFLHGRKGRAFVYVDGIDSILTRDEVSAIASATAEAGGTEAHCLAWEFEMDLRLTCHEVAASKGVQIRLIPIPREIMEKNRTSPPPFLEVAVLEAEPVYRRLDGSRVVDIKLSKFMPSLAEVPAKELEGLRERVVQSGFDFIDFWAVDFDWTEGEPFEHHWQDFRTRKDRSLKTVSDADYARYPRSGVYTACVKVVDVFGCDTSITVEVEVE